MLYVFIELMEREGHISDFVSYPYIGKIRSTSLEKSFSLYDATSDLVIEAFEEIEAPVVFMNENTWRLIKKKYPHVEMIAWDELPNVIVPSLPELCKSIIQKRRFSRQRKHDLLKPLKAEIDRRIEALEERLFDQDLVNDQIGNLDELNGMELLRAEMEGV